ncbi:MAG: hypothetical protein EOO23_08300 [Comamonadaceae bacterium]|nr:MAG: hypothetical protein EOO23_08300 [Comamonadaceae bacterium]
MKIRVLMTAWTLAVLAASPALACSLHLTSRPGETEAQTAERVYRSAQDRLWTEADVVFIGDVRSLRRIGGGITVEVRPHQFLKGSADKALLTYVFSEDVDFACGFKGFPTVTTPGLFYARQSAEGGLDVTGMLNVTQIRDRELQGRIVDQIDVIASAPEVAPGPESTLPIWLGWSAGASFISLLVGFLIGRGRTARTKKSKTS